MAAHAYVVGHTTISGYLIKSLPPLHPLIQSAQKMAEYFHGATRLYNSVTHSQSTRKMYSNLKIIEIPAPEPVYVSIETDWYHGSNVFTTEPQETLCPSQEDNSFIASHGSGITEYEKWPIQKFVSHCEIT